MEEFIDIGIQIGYIVSINKQYYTLKISEDKNALYYTESSMCCFKRTVTIPLKDVYRTVRAGNILGIILHSSSEHSILIRCPNEELAIHFTTFINAVNS